MQTGSTWAGTGGSLRFGWTAGLAMIATTAAISAAFAGAGSGPCWCEDMHGEAGALPGPSAQVTQGSGPLTCIIGRIKSVAVFDDGAGVPDLEDMYLIRIDEPTIFSARTITAFGDEVPRGATVVFDTQLWLFETCGDGLLANDDDPCAREHGFSFMGNFSNDGTGIVITKPGLYYIALSRAGDDPLSQGGPIFDQQTPIEVSGPDGPGGGEPIVAWTGKPPENPEDLWYRIELTGCTFATPITCPSDINGDNVTNGADLGIVLAAWGTAGPGDFNMDGVVDGADLGFLLAGFGQCQPPAPVCGNPETGSCFQPHFNPACDDACCCQTVCAIDPFCCDVSWDAICAGEAADVCGATPPAGSCCVPSGAPGCDNPACEEVVCDIDPFCCASSWDASCAMTAAANCGTLCGGGCPMSDHSCYAQGGPGCNDPVCCKTICAIDPLCCESQWDGICVEEAILLCGPPACEFACPPCAIPEGEPCGADTNGGCNSMPPVFSQVVVQEVVCGNAWAAGGTRDTDWYQFTVTDPSSLRFTAFTTLPIVIGLVNTGGVPDCTVASALDPFLEIDACSTGALELCLAPGTYWFFVAPQVFDGIPCDSASNAYWFKFELLGPCLPTCAATCPADAIEQNDACGGLVPDPNGGCNFIPAQYQDVGSVTSASPITVCGDVGTFGVNARDLDWYRFSLPVAGQVRVTIENLTSGGLPAPNIAIFIVQGADCATQVPVFAGASGLCPFVTPTVALPPGNHVVIVTVNSFAPSGPACPVQYVATIEVQ